MSKSPFAVGAGNGELLAFQVGEQEYCIDIMSVREIRGWTQVTALPRAPDYVRGVVNLRGAVLPIIDLAARLGLTDTEASSRSVIIVVEVRGQVTGLLVDAVSGILTVSSDMVQPTPEVASSETRGLLQGIVTVDGRMIAILALESAVPPEATELHAA